MTKDDIIRIAAMAGCGWIRYGTEPALFGESMLERFAALVAAHERESCARHKTVAWMDALPEGWQLVPIEPTDEMIFSPSNCEETNWICVWKAMLAAAPKLEDE